MTSVTIRPPFGGRPIHAAEPRVSDFSALDLWAFVVPAISFIEITIIGRLIVAEIVMLAMLPWLWNARDRLAFPRWFVVLWAGWLLGQILTDMVVRSTPEDYVRGWAAIAFTLTNFAAILVLAGTARRARLFALGIAIGGALSYALVPSPLAASDPWKWALAVPVAFGLATMFSGRLNVRMPWLTAVAFAAFASLNLFLGYRSLGGVSLLTAGYLGLSAVAAGRQTPAKPSFIRAGAGLAILGIAMVGTLQLYDAAASGGWLGQAAQAKYAEQSGALGVLVGGRSEVLVSSQAIIDSPILGHGSWAKDFAYVDLLADRLSSFGYEMGGSTADIDLIPAHSYLMGSWVWAGFLGGLFWLAILGIAVRLLANLYLFATALAPLFVFSTMLLLWNIAFSPYGFSARILTPFGIVICILALRPMRGDENSGRTSRLELRPSRLRT